MIIEVIFIKLLRLQKVFWILNSGFSGGKNRFLCPKKKLLGYDYWMKFMIIEIKI